MEVDAFGCGIWCLKMCGANGFKAFAYKFTLRHQRTSFTSASELAALTKVTSIEL